MHEMEHIEDQQSSAADPEASLRAELLQRLIEAQAELEESVVQLRLSLGADSALISEGEAQLAALQLLRQHVGNASGAGLVRLRVEVGAFVSSSQAHAQQTRLATITGDAASLAAAYDTASAALDRRVAATMAEDQRHLAYARDLALRYGIDLDVYEAERERLEAEREAARQRGDKVAERTADVLIAENTYNTMSAAGADIADPGERERHEQELRAQQAIIAERRAVLEAQLALEARRISAERGLHGAQADAFEAAHVREGMDRLDQRSAELETTVDEAVATARAGVVEVEPACDVPGLSESNREAALEAAQTIRAAFDASTAIDDIDLAPASSTITLSTAPEAHERIEVPIVQDSTSTSTVKAVAP